jgi:hypothetical protein
MHRLLAGAGALTVLTTGAGLGFVYSLDVAAPVATVISHLEPAVTTDGSSGSAKAMDEAIRQAASMETHDEIHVDRIDYVGRHDNGAHSVAFIFYVYFSDSSGLGYERFVRVLRTADGTLHVLAA